MMNIEHRKKNREMCTFKQSKGIVLFLSLFILLFTLNSCKSEFEDNSDRFKLGVFEIPAGKGFVKETIIRKDSIQISKHGDHIDTLSIKWKNNFFYTLKYINPKNDLQKDPMFVQINKLKENSYDFTVKIGFSKFSKKATMFKVK
ncbi:hypothetical protein [Polaribacter litorisediminis]|uniref:hypothetical protein n=1 Tax=Polaribacter litorisediminis TaxID=1908341 RepID=UPI001CC12A6C|nr:hypothetical protein [Polaribacter litorisediminis]